MGIIVKKESRKYAKKEIKRKKKMMDKVKEIETGKKEKKRRWVKIHK